MIILLLVQTQDTFHVYKNKNADYIVFVNKTKIRQSINLHDFLSDYITSDLKM